MLKYLLCPGGSVVSREMLAAREVRAMLTARKLVQSKLLDVENSLRGILRGSRLKKPAWSGAKCVAIAPRGGNPGFRGSNRR